ncbi:hypothetical protein [Brumimicrobium sp.]|uniref:hypothetical protein n=1 Tax=Brumimicrobium sp. TaxID=2029867 RepID=UPI003A90B271
MKSLVLSITIGAVLMSSYINAQMDLIFTPGYGVAFTKSNIHAIQDSYSSYILLTENDAPEGITVNADPNFDRKHISDFLSFQLALSGNWVYFGISYMPNKFVQERSVMYSNGYGRTFRWEDKRNEVLFDFGFGSKYIDVFGTFGVNFNKYRMTSYQVYPDGSKSLSNDFYFNGVFKTEDTGLAYGFGIKIKPINFLAIDVRYLYANHKMFGEYRTSDITEGGMVLTDFSFARSPVMSEFPQDFNAPYSHKNSIAPMFNKHYLTISLIFHYRTND